MKQIAAVVTFCALLVATAARLPRNSVSPPPALRDLASEEADFRGCDRDWSKEVPPSPEVAEVEIEHHDFRGCDGGWTRVDDFWTFKVEDLYRPASGAEEDSPD